MLPLKLESLNRILAATLSALRGKSCGYRLHHAEPVSGGDISCAIRLLTDGPEFFLQLNSRRCAAMFRAEMVELHAIATTCTIRSCRTLAIAAGYQQRREIDQLYRPLNHANLFAGSYCDAAEQALARLLAGDN